MDEKQQDIYSYFEATLEGLILATVANTVYASIGRHGFCKKTDYIMTKMYAHRDDGKSRARSWFLKDVKNTCQQAVPIAAYTNR